MQNQVVRFPAILRGIAVLLALVFSATVGHGQIFISNFTAGTIGEYNFDGTPVNPALITGLSGPWSMAASSDNLFVAFSTSGTVSKYNFNGSAVNTSLITGLDNPSGIAVFGSDLFVSSAGSNTISLYNLDGVFLSSFPVGGGYLGGLTVAIPEPATYAMLLGATTLLVIILKRRYWSASPCLS